MVLDAASPVARGLEFGEVGERRGALALGGGGGALDRDLQGRVGERCAVRVLNGSRVLCMAQPSSPMAGPWPSPASTSMRERRAPASLAG